MLVDLKVPNFTEEEYNHLDYHDKQLYNFLREKQRKSDVNINHDNQSNFPKTIAKLQELIAEVKEINKSPNKDVIIMKLNFDVFINECNTFNTKLDELITNKTLNKESQEYKECINMIPEINKKIVLIKDNLNKLK